MKKNKRETFNFMYDVTTRTIIVMELADSNASNKYAFGPMLSAISCSCKEEAMFLRDEMQRVVKVVVEAEKTFKEEYEAEKKSDEKL